MADEKKSEKWVVDSLNLTRKGISNREKKKRRRPEYDE